MHLSSVQNSKRSMIYVFCSLLSVLAIVPFWIMIVNATRSSQAIQQSVSLIPGTYLKYNWDVLASKKAGVYSIKKHQLSRLEIVNFLLFAMMKIDDAGYYSLVNLENSLYLFPFEYKVNKEGILEDDRFTTGTFGGELSVALKR